MRWILVFIFIGLAVLFVAPTAEAFELSFQLEPELPVFGTSRGIWFKYDTVGENPMPTQVEVQNAVNDLAIKYRANKLYLMYSHQVDIQKGKELLLMWKTANEALPGKNRMELVPALGTVTAEVSRGVFYPNFTAGEIEDFARWSKENINSRTIAFFLWGPAPKSLYESHIVALNNVFPNSIIWMWAQPGQEIDNRFIGAVEDTWGGEASGFDNSIWSNPPTSCGLVGKPLLSSWVNERVADTRPFSWNLVIVGWDYDPKLRNPDCEFLIFNGRDDANTNDPVAQGRVQLAQEAITSVYQSAGKFNSFGGLSTDMYIFHGNSRVRDGDLPNMNVQSGDTGKNTFYYRLKNGQPYEGVFAVPWNDVISVFSMYNPPSPTSTVSADANGDGRVDGIDCVIWSKNYGRSLLGSTNGDFDNNGKVEMADFGVWKEKFLL